MPTYNRFNLSVAKGEGAYVTTTDGRRLLDFGAGVAVNALGHCHPRLVAALQDQATRLWHCSNLYHIEGQERLAARLVDATFADAVFFCNSGAEALECTLKLARKYHDDQGRPERYRVITCAGAFHGRTLATLAAGGSPAHLAGFDPVVDGFDQVPFADADAVRRAIGDKTAAILVEPIQGEGGIHVASVGYLRELRAIADEHGLLLCLDEVQTGNGRTGRLFAHEAAGIVPDVMATAKGLGGGFPVGACLAAGKAAETLTAGSHGTTFGGNPLAMAVANAVLDELLAPGFLDRVAVIGARLAGRLASLPIRFPSVVREVRGVGLMLGLACTIPNRALINQLIIDGLLTIPAADNVARLLPPLIIGEAEVDEAVAIIEQSCSVLAEKAA